MEEIPDSWNPHQKLDFVKVKLRDLMLTAGRLQTKKEVSALNHTNCEIERLEKKRETLMISLENANGNDSALEIANQINNITEAIVHNSPKNKGQLCLRQSASQNLKIH